jgi:deoxyribonuclease V
MAPPSWAPGPAPLLVGGAFVAFARGEQGPGRVGDRARVGAALALDAEPMASVVVTGRAGASYAPGLLAAREGSLLVQALHALPGRPDVLLVDATGRDHPRRAGLALHVGAVLGLPSVGVTHRPLLASGPEPPDVAGASTELRLDGELVGRWLRTRRGVRPLAVHAGWRTDDATAVEVVMRCVARARTPEPLRLARMAAREARSAGARYRDRP